MTSADAAAYVNRFAAAIDAPPLTEQEMEDILELAGVAAHASVRQAAPLACWVAARAGLDPDETLSVLRSLEDA